MRYFRRNSFLLGEQRCEEGIIKSEHEFSSTFNGNEYWEEVIVTPKPQPKKIKKEIALFRAGDDSIVACTASEYTSKRYPALRITDWVEVEFVERT